MPIDIDDLAEGLDLISKGFGAIAQALKDARTDELEELLGTTLRTGPRRRIRPLVWSNADAQRIIEIAGHLTQKTPRAITGNSRVADVVRPRHAAIYVIRTELNLSYPDIGRLFHRDHATVISSIKRVQSWISSGNTTNIELVDSIIHIWNTELDEQYGKKQPIGVLSVDQ